MDNLPSTCPCGAKFTVDHALIYKLAGFIYLCHDELTIFLVRCMEEVHQGVDGHLSSEVHERGAPGCLSLLVQFQVEAKSILGGGGGGAAGHAIWIFKDIHMKSHEYLSGYLSGHSTSNLCSELAAIWASCLDTLQPANSTASQQIGHTHAHGLISL